MTRTLRLERIDHHRRQLHVEVSCAGYRFATSWWYHDVDLDALGTQLGPEAMERLLFHIALFEVNKVASLRPDVLDLGPWARFHTERLEALWREVFRRVWAQWRYQHDLPDYAGPAFASAPVAAGPPLVRPRPLGEVAALVFCGGGKDSLVSMRLLETAGTPHASLAYSHSIYGRAEPQHALIDGLLDLGPARRRHRMSVQDDFLDAPVVALADELGVRELLAAETPASMFAALPILLQHGYAQMVLGHEHSANVGNLVWDATGEDVNHQWGKSLEAERLLDGYLREVLLPDARYFSILQPTHDVLIFQLLAADDLGVERTHSCNVAKPWCERCPKCAYVWLNYMAHLDLERVRPLFRTNLLDAEANQLAYRQMLGLEEHTPFECIGQIDEVKLAFELCRRKGLRGRAMDVYAREVAPIDPAPILARTLAVHRESFAAPEPLAGAVLARMESVAAAARATLASRLG
ncbi:MAG: hypothetical protein AAGH15_03360 [Myxococcota bacterium]